MSSDMGRLHVRRNIKRAVGKKRLRRQAALQGYIFLHYTKHASYRQEKGNAVDKGAAGGVCWRKQLDQ